MLSIDISGFCITAVNSIYLVCVYVNSKDPFSTGSIHPSAFKRLTYSSNNKMQTTWNLSLGILSNLVKSKGGLIYFPSHNLQHFLSTTFT